MNFIISGILILISVGIFFTTIDPMYRGSAKDSIKALLQEKERFDLIFNQTKQIDEYTTQITKKYNQIDSKDLFKIQKMIPEHINNIELIVDIDRLAKKNNIRNLGNLAFIQSVKNKKEKGKLNISEHKDFDSVVLEFSFISNYDNFKALLDDLRRSVRLVDVVGVEVRPQANKEDEFNTNLEFHLSIRTY